MDADRTRRATITMVADRASVSRQTVSNVLNAPHRVQQETRERVEAVIRELDYRPHRAARQLRTHRSNLIAIRVDPFSEELAGSVLDRFVHAVTEAAQQRGFRTLVFTATDDEDEIANYADLLNSYELDAFLLTGTHHGDRRTAWLNSQAVPFVTFGRPWGAAAEHCWVDVDGRAGTAAATGHLLAAGHRRVGFLGWPEGSGVGDDRRRGWHQALRAAAVDPDGLLTSGENTVNDGHAAAAHLLGTREVDALVCVSDTLALGAMRMVRDRVSRGAAALPVIGFDDSPTAATLGLSTIAQPLRAAADACLELLTGVLDRDREPRREQHVLLTPQLVLRDSG